MSTLQFYRTIADDTVACRCLALIERHAPGLMRCGGGSLEREMEIRNHRNRTATITPAQHAKICALYEAGVDLHAIAKRMGRSYNAVVRHSRALRQRRDAQ